MTERGVSAADLRAAVAAGQLSKAQAAGLAALARARALERAGTARVDEPFELYRGFNDIFVAIGVLLLFLGLEFLSPLDIGAAFGPATRRADPVAVVVWTALLSGLSWGLAGYLTRRRRMIAPSIVLVSFLSYHLCLGGALALAGGAGLAPVVSLTAGLALAALGAAAFHLRFGLPFALLPIGVSALAAGLMAAGLRDATALARLRSDGLSVLLDMGAGTAFPLVTLAFGLAGFALAMRFDLGDPHRLTRRAASAFWLHLQAAAAIVNTAAFTLYASGGAAATAGLVGFLLAMAAVALVIDRRSFLLAGIGYAAALLLIGLGEAYVAEVLVLLGLLLLGLGAGWVRLRGTLMRALPAFPGKERLPPYRAAPETAGGVPR